MLALWEYWWDASAWGPPVPPTPPIDTHDGADADTYKRHRKRIERSAHASEAFILSKYVKQAKRVARVADTTPLNLPVIAQAADTGMDGLSISILQDELAQLLSFIDAALAQAKAKQAQQRLNDEIAILMLLA